MTGPRICHFDNLFGRYQAIAAGWSHDSNMGRGTLGFTRCLANCTHPRHSGGVAGYVLVAHVAENFRCSNSLSALLGSTTVRRQFEIFCSVRTTRSERASRPLWASTHWLGQPAFFGEHSTTRSDLEHATAEAVVLVQIVQKAAVLSIGRPRRGVFCSWSPS